MLCAAPGWRPAACGSAARPARAARRRVAGFVYERSGNRRARRVDPGGLHPGPADPVLGRPIAQRGDPDGGRGERPGVMARRRTPRSSAGPARGHLGVAVHVQPGAAEHQHVHFGSPPEQRSAAGPPPRGGPVGQESEVRARSSRTGCLRASTPYSYASSRHQASPASYQRRRPGDSHPAGWAAATVSSYDQIVGWDADLRLLTPRAISVSAPWRSEPGAATIAPLPRLGGAGHAGGGESNADRLPVSASRGASSGVTAEPRETGRGIPRSGPDCASASS